MEKLLSAGAQTAVHSCDARRGKVVRFSMEVTIFEFPSDDHDDAEVPILSSGQSCVREGDCQELESHARLSERKIPHVGQAHKKPQLARDIHAVPELRKDKKQPMDAEQRAVARAEAKFDALALEADKLVVPESDDDVVWSTPDPLELQRERQEAEDLLCRLAVIDERFHEMRRRE